MSCQKKNTKNHTHAKVKHHAPDMVIKARCHAKKKKQVFDFYLHIFILHTLPSSSSPPSPTQPYR
jgi:hypothetical protein